MGNLLHFDIETVSLFDPYDKNSRDPTMAYLWNRKYSENNPVERMPLYAEFAKVLCISLAYETDGVVRVKTIAGDDEKDVLVKANLIFMKGEKLAGFNILGFDIPFLCKRYIANGITIPPILNQIGRKPREIPAIDIMKMRSVGGTSAGLETICYVLGIPSPKDGDVTGSTINEKYWASRVSPGMFELLLKQVEEYCEKDVSTAMQVYNKINSCL